MAEWSKALVLGTSLFGGVGSNPTSVTFWVRFYMIKKSRVILPQVIRSRVIFPRVIKAVSFFFKRLAVTFCRRRLEAVSFFLE